MKKNFIVYFEDILESIRIVEKYTKNMTNKKFGEQISIQDAVLMRFAVIGESANKIPLEIRRRHKEIPWRKIINLRNLIVHDYSSINIDRIWGNIQKDLPTFKKQIEKLTPTT